MARGPGLATGGRGGAAGAAAHRRVRGVRRLSSPSAAGAAAWTLAGFVDDLEEEYAAAAVVAVPLHHGAGVKFKTIEALVRAVPVVSTPVGAEGIGDGSRYAGFTDNPSEFAEALLNVVDDWAKAEAKARDTANWAITEFGRDQFETGTQASYATSGWQTPLPLDTRPGS